MLRRAETKGEGNGDPNGEGAGGAIGDGQSDPGGPPGSGERRAAQPKTRRRPAGFRNVSNGVLRERLLLVRQCLALRLSTEQMVDFLPTWGLKLSRSRV